MALRSAKGRWWPVAESNHRHAIRAILAEQRWNGDEFWARFKAGKEDQLWYYSASCQAYEKAGNDCSCGQ
jgi:hypothetical protein